MTSSTARARSSASTSQVRRDLGARYRHIFVDEFQNTDPIQAEILFLIASDDRPGRWQEAALQPGALFMVGDPKQAIYRLRGADIGSYGMDAVAHSSRANLCPAPLPSRSGASL
jgi:ATP-dependent exoDNAse (exonuclease V) beta subunit